MERELKMREEYERDVPRADGGSYGTSTDIFNLPVGTEFEVFNGNWNGKIIERDSKKFMQILENESGEALKEVELKENVFYDLVVSLKYEQKKDVVSKGSYYRHYKGGIYVILNTAIHTEDEVELVIYADQKGNIWARPLEMFIDELEFEGRIVKRFSRMKYSKGEL